MNSIIFNPTVKVPYYVGTFCFNTQCGQRLHLLEVKGFFIRVPYPAIRHLYSIFK